MQPSGADVFGAFIHLPRGFSNLGDTVCTEADPEVFCSEQRLVLFSQRGVRLLSMRSKSFAVSASSSTRIGSRP